MQTLKDFILSLATPRHVTIRDGISYWQERVLLVLLLLAASFGTLTWIPSVYLSIQESLWTVAIIDTLSLGFIFILFFIPSLPYTFRAGGLCLVSYLLGLVLIFAIGPFGAGVVWLFVSPVLTALLLRPRMSLLALAINALTLAVMGYFIVNPQFGFFRFNSAAWTGENENLAMKWFVISLNFLLLNVLCSASIITIGRGIQRSLSLLSSSEKRYRRIYDNVVDVYFEITGKGRIVEVSPSVTPILAYTRDELIGSHIRELYFVQEDMSTSLRHLLAAGYINGLEIELRDKHGGRVICSINARLIPDSMKNGQAELNGQSRHSIVGIFRDISAQKAMALREQELNRQLSRSQKMELLGVLAGGVAHDLNNVLSGIVTYPELMLMDLPPDSPLAKRLKVIQKSGARASAIVQDLLTLSRRGVVHRQIVDLHEIIREFLSSPECSAMCALHPGVTIIPRLTAETTLLKGSAIHLQKTVMNLIANGAEAQPNGGALTISTSNCYLDASGSLPSAGVPVGYEKLQPGHYLQLSVEDEGEGIAPEHIQRIFEPFFTRKVMGRSGTGLGMTVVLGTVQDHDGYIDVVSKPGSGSRFSLYFPTTGEAEEPTGKSIETRSLQGKGETLLLVDDMEEQREIAGAALRRLGYQVGEAESGEAAIAHLQEHNADLVILDMLMAPGIDGLETIRRIRTFKPHQKVIIASGFALEEQMEQSRQLGVTSCIRKPYSMEQIGLAVLEALRETGPSAQTEDNAVEPASQKGSDFHDAQDAHEDPEAGR